MWPMAATIRFASLRHSLNLGSQQCCFAGIDEQNYGLTPSQVLFPSTTGPAGEFGSVFPEQKHSISPVALARGCVRLLDRATGRPVGRNDGLSGGC